MNINFKQLLTMTLFLGVVACGGGGSSDDGAMDPPAIGGISGNGVAVGPISTFGSIVVNGVHYDTSSASFSIDDNPGTESDLSVGDIVIVRGTIDADGLTGTAANVFSDDVVTGPIESIDTALRQIVVLGQLVLVGPETLFDDNISPASLDGLSAGDIVEVSGFFKADGNIDATRIEMKPAGSQLEVHGFVSGLDTAAFSFVINGLSVDYSTAELADFPNGEVSENDFVEAKGNSLGSNRQLIASRIEFENTGLDASAGTHIEIEGFITRFASATDFDVAGISVITDSGTVYDGGTSADLALNVKVEVEGEINDSGVLVAEKVDIRRGKNVQITATVDSVDTQNRSLVMLGVTVTTDALTRFDDGSDADVRPLTINDLNAGDYLEVRGAETAAGSGQVLAAILKREDPDSKTELRGFVESVAQPSFTVLGVTVNTASGTVFRDVDDSVISAGEFFSQVDANTLINVDGTETGDSVISASEVELELE